MRRWLPPEAPRGKNEQVVVQRNDLLYELNVLH